MAYIGKQPTVGNFVKLDAITTSATTTFNLTNGGVAYSPQSANHCIVSLNGVIQSPGTSFTISGSTIVFASALTSSDVIDFILVLGDVLNIGTPSDATVGFSKITSNLITGATSETSIAGGDQILIYDDSATALRKMTRTNLFSGVAINGPAFFATQTSSFTVNNNTSYTVPYNNEVFDTANCYDNSTYIFTPNVAGYYFVCGQAGFAPNGAPSRFVSINKNGTDLYSEVDSYNTLNYNQFSISGFLSMNGTTDNVKITQFQNSGSNLASGTGFFFFGFLARTN